MFPEPFHFQGPSIARVVAYGIIFAVFSTLWGAGAHYALRKALVEKKENFFTNFIRRIVREHGGATRKLMIVLPIIWLAGIVKDTVNIAKFVSPIGFWWQIATVSSILFGFLLAAIRYGQ